MTKADLKALEESKMKEVQNLVQVGKMMNLTEYTSTTGATQVRGNADITLKAFRGENGAESPTWISRPRADGTTSPEYCLAVGSVKVQHQGLQGILDKAGDNHLVRIPKASYDKSPNELGKTYSGQVQYAIADADNNLSPSGFSKAILTCFSNPAGTTDATDLVADLLKQIK